MTNNPYILAHDLGTTGNKATLFDTGGKIVAAAFTGYPTAYPHPNWAEQDPAHWKGAVFDSTRRLLAQADISPDRIAVVSFSGHMQGALLVDKQGRPVRPAIIWADQRAGPQADVISRTCGEAEIYQLTGHRVSPAYTAAKVMWVRDNQPDIYKEAHHVLQAKDYAAFLLTGLFATDYSDASSTQLFDLLGCAWANETIEQLGLSPALFPRAYPSATIVGEVTAEAAGASGLRQGTPVVIGGGDGSCATVGAGSVSEGDVYNYIGSSSWVGLTTGQPVFDPERRTYTFIHLDPELYFSIGTMQAAGGAYDWLERLLREDRQKKFQHAALDAAAKEVAPGGNGLLFLPHLLGERSPHWNPQARAAFIGLAMPDGRGELARAVMEGVAFNLRHILDALQSQGVKVEAMRLIGGGSRSPVWRQILADVYNLPILKLSLPAEATALGAAVAGGIGVGIYPDYKVVRDLVPVSVAERPNPAIRARYDALYGLFRESYQLLEPLFERLATLPD